MVNLRDKYNLNIMEDGPFDDEPLENEPIEEGESFESKMGMIEGAVEIDEVVWCALKHAFEVNPEAVKKLEEGMRVKDMDILRSAFDGVERMRITPSDKMKTVYSQIAKKELERMEAGKDDDDDLSCGHSREDHEESLRMIVEKMSGTVN